MSRGAFDSVVATIVGGAFLILVLIATIGTAERMQEDSELLAAGTGEQMVIAQTHTATPAPTASMPAAASPSPPPTATATPAPTETPEPTATHTPRPTETFTATPPPTQTTAATIGDGDSAPTPPPTPAASLHFWLSRPIGPDGVDHVARFYPYGSTGEGQYDVHHGVEFVNPEGTAVLATAPGNIIYAGTDAETVIGPSVNYYGNVVVQELERRWNDQPVYVVYGHMASISVSTGESVETGDQIGIVGETGIALGPHLHLEVRVGTNSFMSTRNPQLWLTPQEDQGILVGRILDLQGNPVEEALVSLHDPQTDEMDFYEHTYAGGTINADDEWNENLLIGDVPAGQYRVAANINGQTRAAFVTIRPGEISYVRLQERPRPTATATPLVTATHTAVPATNTPVPEAPAPTATLASEEPQQEQ